MEKKQAKISLVLPFAPFSANAMYQCARGRIILSKKARDFKLDVANHLSRLGAKRIKGKISLTLIFMFKDKRRRDLDNMLKPLLDALKNSLFDDDSMIQKISARKILSGESNSIGICVKPC